MKKLLSFLSELFTSEPKPECCSECKSTNFTKINNVFVPMKECSDCGNREEACF